MADQKIEVAIAAKDDGLFAMLARGIKSVQDFAQKNKEGSDLAAKANAEQIETLEKLETKVRTLTQSWMKLKAQQLGGDSSRETQDALKANEKQLGAAMRDRNRAKSGLGITDDIGGMAAMAGNLKGMAMNALGAYASFQALKVGIKESVTGTLDWVKSSQAMSSVLGISTEQASVLKVAIGDVYATEEEFNGGVAKVTASLNKHEEYFHKLGVATRDSGGHLRNTVDIMLDTNTALGKLKSGTDRNVAAQAIYGKSWMEMRKVMQINNDVIDEARKKSERLGLIVGGDLVEATNRFKAAQNDAEDVLTAMKVAVGQELLPVLTDFNEWAGQDGPKSLGVLTGAIRVVITVWKTLVFIIQAGGALLGTVFGIIIDGIAANLEVISRLASGDFKGAWAAMKSGWQGVKNNIAAGMDEIKERWQNLGEGLNKTWDPNLRPKAKTAPKGAEGKTGDTFTKEKEEKDKQFEQLKAQLEQERAHYENSKASKGEYLEWNKTQDAQYWREVLSRTDLTDKTRARAQQEYFKSRRDVLKKSHDEELQMSETYAERDKTEALGELEAQQALVERAVSQNLLTEQIGLYETARIEQEKYEIEKKWLERKLELAKDEPAQRAKIWGELEALNRSHDANQRTMTFQGEDLERKGNSKAGALQALQDLLKESQDKFSQWRDTVKGIFSGVQSAFQNSIHGMLTGSMTPLQALKSLWAGLGDVAAQAISKIISQKIEAWMVDKAISAWQSADTAKKVAEDTAETSANTADAASGVFKAHAGIPFVGIAIAIGLIALMLATMGSIKAHANGGVIDGPTLALMGEIPGSKEIVANERDFKSWAADTFNMGAMLGNGIQSRRSQLAGYEDEAAANARRTGREASTTTPGGASDRGGKGGGVHFHLATGAVLDTSGRGKQQLARIATDAMAHADTRNSYRINADRRVLGRS